MSDENNAESIIKFATDNLHGIDIETIAHEYGGETVSSPVAIVNKNGAYTLESVKKLLDEYRTRPERLRGVAVFRDIESFSYHVNRFKTEHSVLFADPDPDKPSLIAVLNYNEKPSEHDELGDPDFGDHRSRYAFPLSEEWKRWRQFDGKVMEQVAFAEFIEERIADVCDPTGIGDALAKFASDIDATFAPPSRLIDLSRGLSVRVDAQFQQKVNLGSGETKLVFAEEHKGEDGKPLVVPGAFVIAIPVFQLGHLHKMGVRLRYSVQNGRVAWRYTIHRLLENFDVAIREACARASAATELPLMYGAPEV